MGPHRYPEAAGHVLVRVRAWERIAGVAEATLARVLTTNSWLPFSTPFITGLPTAHRPESGPSGRNLGKFGTILWNPTTKGAIDRAVYDAMRQIYISGVAGQHCPSQREILFPEPQVLRTHSTTGWNHRTYPKVGGRGSDY